MEHVKTITPPGHFSVLERQAACTGHTYPRYHTEKEAEKKTLSTRILSKKDKNSRSCGSAAVPALEGASIWRWKRPALSVLG